MSTIYLASHAVLGTQAAAKVVRQNSSNQRSQEIRFFREAEIIGTIKDPGLPVIYDFGRSDGGLLYIIMELLQGEPLSKRLRRKGGLTNRQAIDIACDLGETLQVTHGHDVVHRDIKPENIFIVPDRRSATGESVKLLDFGVAKLPISHPEGRLTTPGTILGTPFYMAPEQFKRACDVELHADIYSVGCVLYCMLTGEPPFMGNSYGELCAAHLTASPLRPSEKAPMVSAMLDDIVLKCLSKDPAERFPSMRELVASLRSARRHIDRYVTTFSSRKLNRSSGSGTRSALRLTSGLGAKCLPSNGLAASDREPAGEPSADSLDESMQSPCVGRGISSRIHLVWLVVIVLLCVAKSMAAFMETKTQTPGHPVAAQAASQLDEAGTVSVPMPPNEPLRERLSPSENVPPSPSSVPATAQVPETHVAAPKRSGLRGPLTHVLQRPLVHPSGQGRDDIYEDE